MLFEANKYVLKGCHMQHVLVFTKSTLFNTQLLHNLMISSKTLTFLINIQYGSQKKYTEH